MAARNLEPHPFISSSNSMPRRRRRCRRLTRFEKILLAAVAILATALALVLFPGPHDRVGFAGSGDDSADDTLGSAVQTPVPQSTTSTLPAGRLGGRTIIVDAGHGGSDRGCTGDSGRVEKEVNLEIAQRLREHLEHEGVSVIMTRETDDALAPTKEADMAQRVRIIEESDADAFISIHQNQFPEDSTVAGPQVFYAYQGTEGKKLATAIQETLNAHLEPASPRMALDVPYDLLQPGDQPSCTVECGFFSNPDEEELLQTAEYQERLADAIVDGICLYFGRCE